RDRRRARESPRGDGREPPRRPPRQLWQGALPRALVLHPLRSDGADPGAPAHGALRPRVTNGAPRSSPGPAAASSGLTAPATLDRKVVAGAVVLALAGAVAPVLPAYPLTLLTQAVIVAVLAMSLDVLLGYTGLPSLGHAAYFGIAAYTVGILATERQTGLAGCLVGALLLAWAAMGVLVRSPFGLGLKGIRESESRMRALGYNVWLHKYLAFVISGFFAAFAGVLWAYYNGFVGPVDVQLVTSVETLLMVAL